MIKFWKGACEGVDTGHFNVMEPKQHWEPHRERGYHLFFFFSFLFFPLFLFKVIIFLI